MSHWRGFLSNVGESISVGDANPSLLALCLTYARALPAPRVALPVALAAWLLVVQGEGAAALREA